VRSYTGDATMNVVQLFFKNYSSMPINSIKVSKPVEGGGLSMVPFSPIASLGAGAVTVATINLDFNQKAQAARFEISDCNGQHQAVLQPRVGELFNPYAVDMETFETLRKKLQGMNKASGKATAKESLAVVEMVTGFANLAPVGEIDSIYHFAGKTALFIWFEHLT